MRRSPLSPAWPVGVLVLAGMLAFSLPAQAQTITVTSAVPNSGDQGVVDLVVTIGGDGFAKGAKAAFYVTGTTNPGGITVKNVKYKNPKALEATIDVAPDAQTDLKFDIQVTCNGRTGKGTELFSVIKKTADLPPGSVYDLHVVEPDFNTVTLEFTATADDGYDSASGPVAGYDVRIRGGDGVPGCGPWTADNWVEDPWDVPQDPCYVDVPRGAGPVGPLGTTQTAIQFYLAPNTQYYAMARAWDDHTPNGIWSPIDEDLAHQISFTTEPFPETPWSAEFVDACPAGQPCGVGLLGFDLDVVGSPVILLRLSNIGPRLASWTSSGWLVETIGSPVGSQLADFAFDPATGEATIASSDYTPGAPSKGGLTFYRRSRATQDPWEAEVITKTYYARNIALRYNPVGLTPTIAYTGVGKGNIGYVVRLAEKTGATWEIQDLVAGATSQQGLAFDSSGNPGLTYVAESSQPQVLRFALRGADGSWKFETVDTGPDESFTYVGSHHTVAFDPFRGDFSVTSVFTPTNSTRPWKLRFCERSSGSWTCETVTTGDSWSGDPSLAFRADGTAFLAYVDCPTLFVASRTTGEASWTREYAHWNVLGDVRLLVGLDGQPAVAYHGPHDASGVGNYTAAMLARRTPPAP